MRGIRPRDRCFADASTRRCRAPRSRSPSPSRPACTTCRRLGRQARHRPRIPARGARAAASTPRARASSRSPSPARMRRPRPGRRRPMPDLPGRRAHDAAQALPRERPRRRPRQSRIRVAGKGEESPRGGRARRPLRQGPRRPVPDLRLAAPTAISRFACPSPSPRRSTARPSRCPTLDGTKRIRVPAGTQHGTIQRLRGEGPPRPGGRGRRDIHYRLEIEVPSDLNRAGKRAVDDLAKALNGHDPRERLLKSVRAKPTAEKEKMGS